MERDRFDRSPRKARRFGIDGKIKKVDGGGGRRSREKEALRKCGGALARKRARARGKLRDPLAQIAKAATPSTIPLTCSYSDP